MCPCERLPRKLRWLHEAALTLLGVRLARKLLPPPPPPPPPPASSRSLLGVGSDPRQALLRACAKQSNNRTRASAQSPFFIPLRRGRKLAVLCWQALACIVFAAPSVANAESQALLVGVGEHAHSPFNLPGIDKDIYMIRDAVEYLGFAAGNIRTLQHEGATLAAFRRELQRLGAATYGDGDRVVIYFSGHGAQVSDDGNDEADGQDEVLVLHDTRPGGNSGLRNFLRDDEFGALLAGVKATNVLVLVDSCHSGTATKSFPGIAATGVPKFIRNAASPYVGGSTRARSVLPEPRPTHVLLSAAADNELAQATEHGSAFTLGVSEAVKAAREAGSLTPQQLQRAVAKHIDQLLTGSQVHNPQLSGAGRLLASNLFFRPTTGQAPTRRRLEELAAGLPQMPMRTTKTALSVGEKLVFSLEVPRAGYLNVVNVNPRDEAVVLFPNAHHPGDNQVAAGRFELPTKEMTFDLVAREPLGESVTVAFLTERPINLYQDTLKGRDGNGKVVATLASLSAQGGVRMRSIVAEHREGGQNHAAKVVTHVSR